MAMEESMTATIDAAQPKLAVFRNSRWCYFWAGLAFAGVLGAVLLGDRPLHYLPAILALYALQALFAEYLGVTVSAAGVAAPRRLSFLPPQLVMWRIHSSLTDIDNVTSLAKGNDGVVILRLTHAPQIRLLFNNRESKLWFFEALRRVRSDVAIYRRG